MNVNLFVDVVSMLMVIVFALLLGAQVFDAAVNQPVFFSDPPDSVREYVKLATAHRVPAYFRKLVLLTMAATVLAIAACAIKMGPAALVVSIVCAIIYLALIFLFFLPTNRKLGFLPPVTGASPAEPQSIVRLAQRWRMWDRVRILVQFVGLLAAVLSVSAVK
jgi:hypothetical protein